MSQSIKKYLSSLTRLATPVLSICLIVQSAHAALPINTKAPSFTANAALGGKSFNFSLDKELKKGPIVLYFFPVAFSDKCTLEAHLFAEASEEFNKKGVRVFGITAGNVEKVKEFSQEECRNKFAVIADPEAKIAKQYNNQIFINQKLLSDRTSYVITPHHKIVMSYTSNNPESHIEQALKTINEYQQH